MDHRGREGTQCERLIDFLRGPPSTERCYGPPLHRKQWRGKKLPYMVAGQLVPDQLVLGLVTRRLKEQDCRGGYRRIPENNKSGRNVDDLLERQAMSVDGVIELAVPQEELVRRMLARKREDDSPEVFARRIESFERQTAPLLEYYKFKEIKEVNGLGLLMRSLNGFGSQFVHFDEQNVRTFRRSCGELK